MKTLTAIIMIITTFQAPAPTTWVETDLSYMDRRCGLYSKAIKIRGDYLKCRTWAGTIELVKL
jgi:hypothetical protein